MLSSDSQFTLEFHFSSGGTHYETKSLKTHFIRKKLLHSRIIQAFASSSFLNLSHVHNYILIANIEYLSLQIKPKAT